MLEMSWLDSGYGFSEIHSNPDLSRGSQKKGQRAGISQEENFSELPVCP